MFHNYLLVALRNILRYRFHAAVNIGGLALGLACTILVILFARDEMSYDRWIPGTENLYRLELTARLPDRAPLVMSVVSYPIAAAMQQEVAGVTAQTRFHSQGMTLTAGDREFFERVSVVDPGFFTLIRLPLLAGDPGTVFRQPNSLVLSQAAAKKYFGDLDPIGRTIVTGRGGCNINDNACLSATVSLKVTGVMRDLPHNTQLKGDVFMPNTSAADRQSVDTKRDWFSQNGWAYVRLAPGADPAAMVEAMEPVFDRELTPMLRRLGIASMGRQVYDLHMTPFADVHLNSSQWSFNLTPPGSWLMLYGVIAIGLLILLVACFNFMNLATARAMLRAREIALRKTMGARRGQIVLQFLGEAILMTFLALLLAMALVEISLPAFARFLQRPIELHYLRDLWLLPMMLGVALTAGLLSGLYPALVLSRFRPAATLRANSSGQAGSGRLRDVLVVLQFAVSIGLGIAAIVVFSQILYARNIDLGFRHGDIVMMGSGRLTPEKREAFLQALRNHPGVEVAAVSNFVPFDLGQSLAMIQLPGNSQTITLNGISISPDYPKAYGIRLVAGRVLSETRGEDRLASASPDGDPGNEGRNILLNESGARRLGFAPQEAVGKTILLNHNHVRIVGVLADAKTNGALEAVRPTVYGYVPANMVNLAIKLRPGETQQTLDFIDRTWRAFSPGVASQRRFLDETFGALYSAQERQGQMFGIFVAIAILLACLGLFGLAAFTAGRRTREIGIRKVFGARSRDVIFLLLWQFSVPVLLANLIAWPLAWYYLQDWLQGFAYRIDLNPLYFAGVGLAALLIAWVTVFTHAWRVARANPIHALRYE